MRKILLIIALSVFAIIGLAMSIFGPLAENLEIGELVGSWVGGDRPIPPGIEVVMPPNAILTATTDAGTITIKSGKGLRRSYTWNGTTTRSVELWPRQEQERWYGSYGLYYPGGMRLGGLDEGQQLFDTEEEAKVWLHSHCQRGCVYNDGGLVVAFTKSAQEDRINVGVWQILVGGTTASPYQESRFHEQLARDSGRSLSVEEIDRIYEGRKNKIYHTGGAKPTTLEGSSNSQIGASWADH